ncbi:MAG: hypothetical protein ABR508_00475 [Candidatus Baltobacteraceae bacterium]
MPYYVEMLRVRRTLLIVGIVLAVLLVTAIVLRLSLHGSNVRTWPNELSGSPTARVTRTALGAGVTRIVVDDPARKTRAVIVEHPNGALEMNVTEPASRARDNHLSMGSMDENETTFAGGTMRRTQLRYRDSIPAFDIGLLLLVAMPIALMAATMLGGALAKENDGHLELAWTKPVSRETYAVSTFAVDCAGVVAAQLLTVAVLLAACLLFFVPKLTVSASTAMEIAVALLGPLAWCAVITAASASLKRGPGLVCGLGWLVALIIPGTAHAISALGRYNSVAAAIHTILTTLSYLDPVAYLSFRVTGAVVQAGLGLTLSVTAAALAALVLGYLAISVLQWRRAEA